MKPRSLFSQKYLLKSEKKITSRIWKWTIEILKYKNVLESYMYLLINPLNHRMLWFKDYNDYHAFRFLLFLFTCVYAPVHALMCAMQRCVPDEDSWSPGGGVTGNWHSCWQLNSGPLQEQQALVTMELFLQLPIIMILKHWLYISEITYLKELWWTNVPDFYW